MMDDARDMFDNCGRIRGELSDAELLDARVRLCIRNLMPQESLLEADDI